MEWGAGCWRFCCGGSRRASIERCYRRWDEVDLLVFYLDGVRFGEHHVLVAVGVDGEGRKHVLGLAEGASENQVVARGLLEDLVRSSNQ